LRRKWVIVVSLLLWSAATLFTGFAGGIVSLILLRSFATGGGESFYYPSATSLIGQFHQRTRALALSIHQTALYAGVVVSGLLVGYIAQVYGWRHAFYVFGIAGIALAVVMLWRLKDSPHARHDDGEADVARTAAAAAESTGASAERGDAIAPPARLPVSIVLRELSGKPTVALLGLAFAGQAFVDIGYVTWMPTFLQEKFAMSPASAGFSSMFYHHLFALVGILVVGRLTDLWSRQRRQIRIEAQIIGMLGAVPFIWLMGMADSRFMCFAAMALFGLFRGCYESNLYATLFEVIDRRLRSSAVGILISFAFIVGALAPLLLGALKHRLGLGAGLAGLSGVYVFSAVSLLVAWAGFFRRDCIDAADV
jgi:sugar phosphate permease